MITNICVNVPVEFVDEFATRTHPSYQVKLKCDCIFFLRLLLESDEFNGYYEPCC